MNLSPRSCQALLTWMALSLLAACSSTNRPAPVEDRMVPGRAADGVLLATALLGLSAVAREVVFRGVAQGAAARALVLADGTFEGFVGGQCAEGSVRTASSCCASRACSSP